MEAKGYFLGRVRILLLVATAAILTGCSTIDEIVESQKDVQAASDKAFAEWSKNREEWRDNTITFLVSQCILVLQDQPVDREAFLQAGYYEFSADPAHYRHFIRFHELKRIIGGGPSDCRVTSIPRVMDESYVHSLVEKIFLQNGFVRLPAEKGRYRTRYKANNLTVVHHRGLVGYEMTITLKVVD
jgi:uncharacterized protein YceK